MIWFICHLDTHYNFYFYGSREVTLANLINEEFHIMLQLYRGAKGYSEWNPFDFN